MSDNVEQTPVTMESNTKRQRDFKDRQRQAGLVRVEVWVPPDKREQIKQEARKLVEQSGVEPES